MGERWDVGGEGKVRVVGRMVMNWDVYGGGGGEWFVFLGFVGFVVF